jgi:hypothetical protein
LKEILNLSQTDLERLLERLTHYALCKMQKLKWRGAYLSNGGSPPCAYEPTDFALDAIKGALHGKRNWNREKYATLELFLKSVIRSRINNLVKSPDNSGSQRFAPAKNAGGDETEGFESCEANHVKVVILKEWCDKFRAAARKDLEGDSFLTQLFECIDSGYTKPLEIAEVCGISVNDVNNGMKRLRRKLDAINFPGKEDRP